MRIGAGTGPTPWSPAPGLTSNSQQMAFRKAVRNQLIQFGHQSQPRARRRAPSAGPAAQRRQRVVAPSCGASSRQWALLVGCPRRREAFGTRARSAHRPAAARSPVSSRLDVAKSAGILSERALFINRQNALNPISGFSLRDSYRKTKFCVFEKSFPHLLH